MPSTRAAMVVMAATPNKLSWPVFIAVMALTVLGVLLLIAVMSWLWPRGAL